MSGEWRTKIEVCNIPNGCIVSVANSQDDYYRETFRSWDQLNDLIARLRAAGIEAFGPDYSDSKFDE